MNRIKELRTERGITQADLAKILKISDRAVGYYENGDREPDYSTLLKIADYFDVSIDYLLGASDIKKLSSLQSETDFHVGLSKSEESTLTEDEKEEIRNFAKFVMSKRHENK